MSNPGDGDQARGSLRHAPGDHELLEDRQRTASKVGILEGQVAQGSTSASFAAAPGTA